MLPDLGRAAIVLGLALCLYAAGAFALGGRRGDRTVVRSARRALYLAFGFAAVAALATVVSLLTHDFSVLYVVRNNATTTPPFFSVISLWAALEGSILFWTLLLTGWASLVVWRHRDRHQALMPWVGMTLALASAFFFAVMTWPGNPFARITPVAVEGSGPNALLQNHPFMGLHPPLLYLGYTGMAIPFAFGIAALITRRTDEEWLGIVRRWTLVPWIFLTLGITAGAWWSYEVLGWGGYWAWDPVENAALLPWLTATAFIHSSMVAERRGTLKIWSSVLVIATFSLTLLGTFLTRSGVVASVHSFTQSAIGPWFLGAIAVTLVGALGLLVWRLPELGDRRPIGAPVSRESAFLVNNVLFLAISAAVLLGTLYPLAAQAVSGQTASVGAPWFNRVNAPFLLLLLFLMGVGPALPWGMARWSTVRDRFALPVLAGSAAVVAALVLGMRAPAPLATLGLAVFVLVILTDELIRGARARGRARGEPLPTATWRLTTRNRRRYGGYLVHAGICVMAVAIAISASLGQDATATLQPGQAMTVRGYTLTYQRLVQQSLPEDARVRETRAEVAYSGSQSGSLGTALRSYPSSTTPIATPAVITSLGEDLYVTLLSFDPATGTVTLRALVNPLVVWIWLGGGIVGIGAVFAIWPERRRMAVVEPSGVQLGVARGATVGRATAGQTLPETAAPSVRVEEA
jgi:cytochrome c-type biogenesis protein CcmF